MEVLPKRFGKYGLTLHPDKTRLVPFQRPIGWPPGRRRREVAGPGTFDLLGFTLHWGKSLSGASGSVESETARTASDERSSGSPNGAESTATRRSRAATSRARGEARGHYGYFGITGNSSAARDVSATCAKRLAQVAQPPLAARQHDLGRITRLLERYPLPAARIAHPLYVQRTRDLKSRMR